MINPEWYRAKTPIVFAAGANVFKAIKVGPPPSEQPSIMDYCDCCGMEFLLKNLIWTGKQMVCNDCNKDS